MHAKEIVVNFVVTPPKSTSKTFYVAAVQGYQSSSSFWTLILLLNFIVKRKKLQGEREVLGATMGLGSSPRLP
jgi:hypothetical protein